MVAQGLNVRRVNLVLILVTLLAFALRLYRLDYQSLRGDEAVSILYSNRGLLPLLSTVSQVDIHPPLYYLLTYLWIPLAGDSEFAARFPSLVFGVLAVPLAYGLGRVVLAKRVGVLAAFFVAFSSFQVWFAQDARMYTLAFSLTLVSAIVFYESLRKGGRSLWAIYCLSVLLALYTHYYSVFLIAWQGLFLAIFWRRHRRGIRPWILSQFVAVLLFLPWLLLEFNRIGAYGGAGESVGFLAMLGRLLAAFGMGLTMGEGVQIVAAVLFGGLLLLGLTSLWKEKPYAFWFLALALFVPILGVYVASRSRPVFMERYLLFASPAFYLITSCGLVFASEVIPRKGKTAFLSSAVIVMVGANLHSLGNYYFDPQYAKSPDWRSLAEYVQENQREGDVVIQNHLDQSFLYYYRGAAPLLVLPLGLPPDFEATTRKLEEIALEYQRIWLVPDVAGTLDPELFVERWLDRHCYQKSEVAVSSLRLKLYFPPAVYLPQIEHSLSVRLGEGVELIGYDLEPVILHPGDILHLVLYWRALRANSESYTVFTHLIDAQGRIWGQKDNPPQGGRYPTQEWNPGDTVVDVYDVPVDADAPSGLLSLEVGMYLLETGERLLTHGAEGESLGDRVVLPTQIMVRP